MNRRWLLAWSGRELAQQEGVVAGQGGVVGGEGDADLEAQDLGLLGGRPGCGWRRGSPRSWERPG
jgi:hypothetical protein